MLDTKKSQIAIAIPTLIRVLKTQILNLYLNGNLRF
jgi:hypothetical protein